MTKLRWGFPNRLHRGKNRCFERVDLECLTIFCVDKPLMTCGFLICCGAWPRSCPFMHWECGCHTSNALLPWWLSTSTEVVGQMKKVMLEGKYISHICEYCKKSKQQCENHTQLNYCRVEIPFDRCASKVFFRDDVRTGPLSCVPCPECRFLRWAQSLSAWSFERTDFAERLSKSTEVLWSSIRSSMKWNFVKRLWAFW